MLRTIGQLKGMELAGKDGPVGTLEDVYFDRGEWRLRQAVVFTGSWLSGRWIMLPFSLLGPADPVKRSLPVAAGRERIRTAPVPDTDKPVNRFFEAALAAHYGCPAYWLGTGSPGVEAGRSHLLSAEALTGYQVEAMDGTVGRLEDYLVEEADWSVRYLLLGARRWLPGRRMAAPAERIQMVSWRHRLVTLRRFREEIRKAPGFLGPGSLSEEYSRALESHYSTQGQPA